MQGCECQLLAGIRSALLRPELAEMHAAIATVIDSEAICPNTGTMTIMQMCYCVKSEASKFLDSARSTFNRLTEELQEQVLTSLAFTGIPSWQEVQWHGVEQWVHGHNVSCKCMRTQHDGRPLRFLQPPVSDRKVKHAAQRARRHRRRCSAWQAGVLAQARLAPAVQQEGPLCSMSRWRGLTGIRPARKARLPW